MNNQTDLLKIQSWLDGELSAGEAKRVEKWVRSNPEAQKLANEFRMTGEWLRLGEIQYRVEDGRDFYWSGILRGIEREEALERRSMRDSIWQRWIGWLAPASGLALLAFMLLLAEKQQTADSEPPVLSLGHEVVMPTSEMTSITFRSEKEGVTVVWIQARDE